MTGKRLFAGETDAETLERVVRCELPSLAEARPDLPPELEPIVRRALARDPADRYATADEMLVDLRRCLLAQLGTDDPRKQLSAIMHEHFDEQAKYRSAALRGSRSHMHLVTRAPTGSQPTLGGRTRSDTPLALVPAMPDESSAPHTRAASGGHPVSGGTPATGSNPAITDAARTLTSGPGRHWGWWFLLPMLGAGLAVAIVLAVFDWRGDAAVAEGLRSRSISEVQPPGPQRDLPVVPRRIVWNFESEPAGAQVSISGAPPAVAAEIEAQLSGRRTPFSIEIPHDEHTRIEVLFTRPGYKVSRRSLLPISSENINVSLQPEVQEPPEPISKPEPIAKSEAVVKRKPVGKQLGATKLAQQKHGSADDELKDEPTFGSPKDRGSP